MHFLPRERRTNMGRNSKDNSYARFEGLIKISMCYKNYLRHARLDLFKKQFVKNVDDTLDSLKKEHRRIIVKEFFNNKNIYWWTKYYSKSTFYRKRFFAIKSFMEIYSQ